MAVKRETVLHIVTIGNIKYSCEQPISDYDNIGDIVGIKKAPDTGADLDVHNTVSELQRAGKVIRLSCRLANKKTNTILCAIDKVAGALGKLRGKTLAGSPIKSVTIPRKRSRR
jgi:hypothetical protein